MLVVRAGYRTLLGQQGHRHFSEHLFGDAWHAWGVVVCERHPRGVRRFLWGQGRIIVYAITACETPRVLALTAPRDDVVNVHPVDHAGEAIARGSVSGGTLRQQDDDHIMVSIVGEEGHARGLGTESRVQPEATHRWGVLGEERERLQA